MYLSDVTCINTLSKLIYEVTCKY